MRDQKAEKISLFGSEPAKPSPKPSREAQFDASTTDDALAAVTCRLGDASCSRAHASTLQCSTGSRLGRRPQSLLQLQREYGNRYVQRVLNVALQGDGESEIAPEVEGAIQGELGGGQDLDRGLRGQMEQAFGADFGDVRVHTDSKADTLNRSLNARAFATGKDIFFRQGAYNPGSAAGRELLAHELTHVVQQGGGGGVRPKLTLSRPGDPFEQEADRVAKEVMQSQGSSKVQSLDRQAEEDEEPVQTRAENAPARRQVEEEEDPVQTQADNAPVRRQVEEEKEEEPVPTQAGGVDVLSEDSALPEGTVDFVAARPDTPGVQRSNGGTARPTELLQLLTSWTPGANRYGFRLKFRCRSTSGRVRDLQSQAPNLIWRERVTYSRNDFAHRINPPNPTILPAAGGISFAAADTTRLGTNLLEFDNARDTHWMPTSAVRAADFAPATGRTLPAVMESRQLYQYSRNGGTTWRYFAGAFIIRRTLFRTGSGLRFRTRKVRIHSVTENYKP